MGPPFHLYLFGCAQSDVEKIEKVSSPCSLLPLSSSTACSWQQQQHRRLDSPKASVTDVAVETFVPFREMRMKIHIHGCNKKNDW